MKKRMPLYYEKLSCYPSENPVFITQEYLCLKQIHHYHGFCLFLPFPLIQYDISCCFDREIWVLHSNRSLEPATSLAQAAQQNGAKKIIMIHL